MTIEQLKKLNVSTRMIRATAQSEFNRVNSHNPPIFQTVNFDYENVDDGLAVFLGEKKGYLYTRNGNPTCDLFAHLLALLEEGESAIAVASGMAAISSAVLALVEPGDEIISSTHIYGGTRNWLSNQLARLQVKTHFVDIRDYNAIETLCKKNTKVLYTEVLGSPNLVVADLQRLSTLAKEKQLIFIVDSTFTPPPIIQPLHHGADIVIHSTTKYINGHGDAIGGAIIGSFDTIKSIKDVVKLYGGITSPFNAWLAIRGLKTLALRVDRQCSNAMELARYLNNHPKVSHVFYPGLPTFPQHELAETQLHGFGGMLAFELQGGFEAGKKVMDNVRVCNFTTSLGEIDTLIIHPASTSHISLTAEERKKDGISDGLVRLSVGIEDVNDLINDISQALDKI